MAGSSRPGVTWLWLSLCLGTTTLYFFFEGFVADAFGDRWVDVNGSRLDLSVGALAWGLWTAAPAIQAVLLYATRVIGPRTAAVVASLAPASALVATWMVVDDANSPDPSSTAALIYVVLPFWALILGSAVVAITFVLRASRVWSRVWRVYRRAWRAPPDT